MKGKRNGIGKGAPRLAAVAAALLGLAWGAVSGAEGGMAPPNPAFAKWRAEQERRAKEADAGSRRVPRDGELEEGDYGLMPTVMDMSYLANLNQGTMQALTGEELPAKFDLREKGRLTAPKNQNPYGTCWAFASLGAVESAALAEGAGEWDLSENHLANLHGFDRGFNQGGNSEMAQAYLLRWGGPVEESADPYPNPGKSVAGDAVLRVNRVRWFAGKRNPLDHDAVRSAVAGRGAVTVDYKHYKGCYRADTHAYYNPWNAEPDHMVCLVGWDDDYPKENFGPAYVPPANGAYLVRNSWGEDWGDGGYFWVSYYDATFLTLGAHQFSEIEEPGRYGKVYQYDPLGIVAAYGEKSATEWGAAIFASSGADRIGAVGFYAMTPNTSYALEVRRGVTAGAPRSGRAIAEQSGRLDDSGFAVVELDKAVEVGEGELFSVVLKLSTPGYAHPLAVECVNPGYSEKASALPGQTFASANGKNWLDMTEWAGPTASFCVKAYTLGSGGGAVAVLSGIDCYAADNSAIVASGRSKAFACRARYSDGRQADVRPAWSMASGGEWGSIDADGVFTAAEVDGEQTAVVRAEYTEGGVTAAAEFTVTIVAEVPEAPEGLEATAGSDTGCVRLTWKPAARATTHAVYRAAGAGAGSGQARFLGEASGATYADTQAVPGVDYTYFVKGKNGAGSGGFSAGAAGWRALSAPTDVAATDGTLERAVRVTWNAAEGAGAYQVLREGPEDGGPAAVTGWIAGLSWRDETAVPGTVYYYSVRAAVDAEGTRAGEASAPDSGLAPRSVVPESLEIRGPSQLDAGATGFYTAVATYSDGNSNEVEAEWTAPDGEGATGYTFVWKAPEGGSGMVSMAARYAEGGTEVSAKLEIAVRPPRPGAAGKPRVASADSEGVRLEWDAVAGAAVYVLWRETGAEENGGEKLAETAAREWLDATAVPGVTYFYRLAAANASGSGPLSDAVEACIPLSAPSGVAATTNRSDGVRVCWRAVPGATHYRVARAASPGGTKTGLGGWVEAGTYDDASAATGATNWYFVRAATDSDGSRAGPWGGPAMGVRQAAVVPERLDISGANAILGGESSLYVCTAAMSDGTSRQVDAAWSLEGADGIATVDASGRVSAALASGNRRITLRAGYQEGDVALSAAKTLTIVDPTPAKAEITDLSFSPRWPWNGLADIDYTVETAPADTKARVTVMAHDRDHAVELPIVTLSGEGADGPVGAGRHRMTWDAGADYPGLHARSVSVSMTAVPAQVGMPGNLTAAVRTNTVVLSWTAGESAERHEVYRGTDAGVEAAVKLGETGGTTWTDRTGVAGTDYVYFVRAVSGSGQESEFASVAVSLPLEAPTGVSAERGETSVTVQWNAVAGAESYRIRKVSASTEDIPARTWWFESAGTAWTDTDVVPGVLYYYYVAGISRSGAEGLWSESASGYCNWDAQPNLSATQGTRSDGILLEWDAVPHAIAYKIYWKDSMPSSTNKWNQNERFDAGETSWLFDRAQPGKTYYFAFGRVGVGIETIFYTVNPVTGWLGLAAPANVNATEKTNAVTVSWASVAGAEGYRVYRGVSNDTAAAVCIATVGADAGSYADSSGEVAVGYRYWVRAEAHGTPGAWSAPVSAARPLGVPLRGGQTNGTTSVTITWSAVDEAVGYQLWRYACDEGVGSAVLVAETGMTAYTDSTVEQEVGYYYFTYAVAPNGTPGPRSSTTRAFAGKHGDLIRPQNIAASDGTRTDGVLLTWTATDSTGYEFRVYRVAADGGKTLAGTTTERSFLDTGTVPGITCSYKVEAYPLRGNWWWVPCTTGDSGWRGLQAPTGITTVASDVDGQHRRTVSWEAVPGAVSYEASLHLTTSSAAAETWTTATTGFWVYFDRQNATCYTHIRAIGAEGRTSAWSEWVYITW